ncbi:hypothetical protein [Methylobacterium sp. WL120]|uniref:gp53-like domain-containing protein n=1 Tax=Methylobacterium sp. WL120 TaxID=2603887 RepID=UPI0011CB740B|nr:hypothetical protein [Methylobacterium sp. WL120]TXM68206.1 hypothetical protein FV229_08555 [Methylobacterium sp. WL120]
MPSRFDLPPDLDIAVDEDFSKDRLDRAFAYIIQRLLILDSFRPSYDEQLGILRETGLLRLNEAIQPIYERLAGIGQIGVIFSATSLSPSSISTGLKSFVVGDVDRDRFAAAAYLSAHDLNVPENSMYGSLQSYDRATGTVVILVDQYLGEEGATGSEWRLSASAPPNQLTTAHQVGAYTQGETRDLLSALEGNLSNAVSLKAEKLSPILTGTPRAPTASAGLSTDQIATTAFVTSAVAVLKNFISNGAGDALDQFNELANAIGNDPNFAGTMLAGLANRVRFDTSQGLTAPQKAQAIANIGAQANLGFTPVQQGGGNGQGVNKIYLGWDGGSLKVQVDGADQGKIWTAGNAPLGFTPNNFYQKLPSGLIVQGGIYDNQTAADFYIGFPISFPTGVLGASATAESPIDSTIAEVVTLSEIEKNGMAFRRRRISAGGMATSVTRGRYLVFGT